MSSCPPMEHFCMVNHSGLPFYWDRQRKTVALALQGMLWDTQELGSPQSHQHCPKEPSSARKVAWEGEPLLFRPVGWVLADPCSAFAGKHPYIRASGAVICPELNSLLETDERLPRV